MTTLLDKLVTEVSKLPEEEQDAFAALMLSELASERRWQDELVRSVDVLEELADEALKEYREGKTLLFDEDNSC